MADSGTDFNHHLQGETRFIQLTSEVELLRSMECPICTGIALPPIYLCENGHSICNSCKEKLTSCGLFKAKFSGTRNYFQENIVNTSKFKCRYFSDGCREILNGEQKKAHVKICNYRPIQCNWPDVTKCDKVNIPLKEYLGHLRTVHEIGGREQQNEEPNFDICYIKKDFNSNDRYHKPDYLLYDGKEFLSHYSTRNGHHMLWVSLIDQENEAKKYLAKLCLKNKDDQKSKIEWTFPVQSIRKSAQEIRSSGHCVLLETEALTPLLTSVGSGSDIKQKLSTTCRITKVG